MKEVFWLGNSLKNLQAFPEEVKDRVGYTLYIVQKGGVPHHTKPLKGFKYAVTEVIVEFNKNAYRAVYTVKIGENIYVLHCFQKKSKHGISTPKTEIDLITKRLRMAEELAKTQDVL